MKENTGIAMTADEMAKETASAKHALQAALDAIEARKWR